MTRESNLVADLGGIFFDPRIGCVRQHFAANECFDSALFEERYLFGVAKIGIWLVLDNRSLPSIVISYRPRRGSALTLAGLCTLAITGGAVSTRQLTALRIGWQEGHRQENISSLSWRQESTERMHDCCRLACSPICCFRRKRASRAANPGSAVQSGSRGGPWHDCRDLSPAWN